MDYADLADQHIEDHLNMAIARAIAKRKASGGHHSHCEECGTPIPQARRDALPHCDLCIDCAEIMEMGNHVIYPEPEPWWVS